MTDKKIIILAGKGDSTNIIFNALNQKFVIYDVIVEEKKSQKIFIKRRIKKLGYTTVFGQILFALLIAKPLSIFSKNRIATIANENSLNQTEIPATIIKNVSSVNSLETIELLKKIKPDLIIVSGTRIISKKVIEAVNCRFINLHAGITPKYRGVHGTYWALANNDKENSGVTVHYVDEGIDTGNIIYQSQVSVTKNDNFSTYPMLQLAAGIKILEQTITDFVNNKIEVKPTSGASNLYYHPTIWQYLKYRIVNKVK